MARLDSVTRQAVIHHGPLHGHGRSALRQVTAGTRHRRVLVVPEVQIAAGCEGRRLVGHPRLHLAVVAPGAERGVRKGDPTSA
ncbi:MAG: hypothetical protein KAI86_12480, partial [Desulfobacterales bacterium]|nr:hypothetical protein [Desulfobacterales bacterium]